MTYLILMRSMKWCTDIYICNLYIYTHTHHWLKCMKTLILTLGKKHQVLCYQPASAAWFASPGELYVCSCLCPGRQPDVSLHFCQLTLLNRPGSHGLCSAFLIWQCVVIIRKTWVSPKGTENQGGTANWTQCVLIHCTNIYCVNCQYSLMPLLARAHNFLFSYPHK